MKQTRTPSTWYAGVIAKVRTQTETLLSQFETMAVPTTPQAVERTAKALLAIIKLADFADRLSDGERAEATPASPEPEPEPEAERPLNRQERRKLEALTRKNAQASPLSRQAP